MTPISASNGFYPIVILPFEDYAVIGDCRAIALVARSGAIEWLCLPSFSSGSVFAALLDRKLGGAFTLCPVQEHAIERRYIPDTAILETLFTTATGRVRVLDFFSVEDGDRRWQAQLQPQREIIRLVECPKRGNHLLAAALIDITDRSRIYHLPSLSSTKRVQYRLSIPNPTIS